MDLALSLFHTSGQEASERQSLTPSTTSNYFLSLLFFHESTSLSTSALISHEQLKNFQFLKKTFEAALAMIVREKNHHQLVILCPVQQSLMGIDGRSKLEWEWGGIDEEFISMLATLWDCVTTAKGFKLLKQARLVSERIFYDDEGRGWVIQFIDRPLVGASNEGDLSPRPRSPDSIGNDSSRSTASFSPPLRSDSPRFTKAARRSKYLSAQLHSPDPYNDTRRRTKSRPLLTLQIVLQKFPGTPQKLEQLVMDFNDSTMTKDNLDDIRTSVVRLLTNCVELLNQLDSSVLLALLDEYGATVDILDQLLENYIMNSTYDIVFFKITLKLKTQDWELAEATRELRKVLRLTPFQNLDLGQVGLPDTPQHYQCLVSALNEFQSIGVLRTPEEKLGCLVQSIKVSSALTGGADDLIPILLLTVLRSGISNLASNLYYMKNFVLFGDTTRGEYGYSLSTLEAVSRYILSQVKQLSPLSAKNQDYWEKVCAGDLEDVKAIYSNASEPSQSKPLQPQAVIRRPSTNSIDSSSDASINSSLQNPLSASPLLSRDAEGNNGVLLACKAQQVDMLRYLVDEQDCSIHVSNYEGKTPLMLAVDLENVDMVRLILRVLGSDEMGIINKQDVLGNSAVHLCASKGNLTILNELLKANSDLGLPNNEGDTPLIIAAKLSERSENHTKVISMLIPLMKVDGFNRQNNIGDTAFHFITDLALIADLATRGANPEIDNYAGWTPLLKWALHDNVAVVEGLLATGRVDALMTDSRGYTPLHMACLRGNLEMVQMLEPHTPIDYQSAIDGSTPLQLACQSSSVSVVEFLLQNGANPELRDWTNESPADMTNDSAILDLLDNAMLFWDSRGSFDQPTETKTPISVQTGPSAEDEKSPLYRSGKRVIRVVRGTMKQDGSVRYIVKSGSRDMIAERSSIKQESALDSIFDDFPPVVENLEHEETFFKHLNEEILNLDRAVQQARKHARKLSRCTQDVPQQLEILSSVLDKAHSINFEGKEAYVQAMKAIASTQTTMHTSDIESLGNLFEDFSFVIDGTLKAMKHPQEIISSIRQLRLVVSKTEQSMRRSDMLWSGLSSIGGGAMTAIGGAGAALGAVGHVATSTFEAVSGSIGQGGGGSGSRHIKAASESLVKGASVSVLEGGRATSPLLSPTVPPQRAPPSTPPPQVKDSLVVKLSPNSSTTSGQQRSRLSMDVTKTYSTSSLLSSPFSSIAAVASAATRQTPLDETKDKIVKASSLLNCLRSSLFEELAHLQNNHTKELERAMRDFGARQLQIEKSRLRDMVEILNDLRFESNGTTAAAAAGGSNIPGAASGPGSQLFTGSTFDLAQGRASRGVSRQSSMHALSPGIGSTSRDESGILFNFEADEKAEARNQQRQYELQHKNSTVRPKDLQRHLSQSNTSERESPSTHRKDEDSMSEKIPFDD
ncbi:hypothetical protein BGZ80_011258 [Entomortierella chlamydospora]|uniref:VPS9 domain-containing protein n=1 Tax=Entomortierella chlamydospora TaxID=101097 RepID=A0A9P6SZ51_9FUNG|nr:hypothetical protein BGZ80_011258 [Entomortierella chlamydospora]